MSGCNLCHCHPDTVKQKDISRSYGELSPWSQVCLCFQASETTAVVITTASAMNRKHAVLNSALY